MTNEYDFYQKRGKSCKAHLKEKNISSPWLPFLRYGEYAAVRKCPKQCQNRSTTTLNNKFGLWLKDPVACNPPDQYFHCLSLSRSRYKRVEKSWTGHFRFAPITLKRIWVWFLTLRLSTKRVRKLTSGVLDCQSEKMHSRFLVFRLSSPSLAEWHRSEV